jgi:iron complex outermembrane recepter protein
MKSKFFASVSLRKALAVALVANLAAITPAMAQDAAAEEEEVSDDAEIIVTATGREQGASKVPYNVTAQSEAELREENITDIKRLIADSPSINAPGNGARFADSVTVRGLNVSPVNANNLEQFARSTLAYYLDDTPLPNIAYRIKDIARVETLLGPQGTLYGAGSLGGTVRYITNKPQFGETSGRISTSIFVAQQGSLSHDTDAVINLPLGETLAFRGSIARLDDNGYTNRVSNPSWRTGAFAWTTFPDATKNLYKDDDYNRVTSGRASLAWKLSDDVTITVAHAQQRQLAHGTTATSLLPLGVANATTPAQVNAYVVDPGAPLPCGTTCQFTNALETPFLVGRDTVVSRYPEFAKRKFRLSSFDFDADLGFANLHSSTSYFKDSRRGQADYAGQGWLFYYVLNGNFGPTDFATNNSAFITFDNTYKGWNHETRLTSQGDGPFSWIAGIYYTDTDRSLKFSEFVPTLDAAFGVNRAVEGGEVDEGYRENLANSYRELAIYGELGYEITDRWKVNVGGRLFNYKDRAIAQIRDYSFNLVDNDTNSATSVKGKSYFKFNTSYNITDDALIYATVSQGFRRGGTNGFRTLVGGRTLDPDIQNYKPDSTTNYEIGLKGFFADRRLYLQANIYQIDWKDVQTYLSQEINFFPVNGTTNGPDARSRGFEGIVRFNVTDALSLNFATAYTEAEWTETKTACLYLPTPTLPEGGCRAPWEKGGKLGGSPKWKHSGGVRYSGDLGGDNKYWASLSGRFVGAVQVDRGDFPAAAVPSYPSYATFDLRGGFNLGDIDIGLWVENITNKRAQVSQQNDRVMGARILYTAPRTYGLNLSYAF